MVVRVWMVRQNSRVGMLKVKNKQNTSKTHVICRPYRKLTAPAEDTKNIRQKSSTSDDKTYRTDSLVKPAPILVATSVQFGLRLGSSRRSSSFTSLS